jgi:hypothetical protein
MTALKTIISSLLGLYIGRCWHSVACTLVSAGKSKRLNSVFEENCLDGLLAAFVFSGNDHRENEKRAGRKPWQHGH